MGAGQAGYVDEPDQGLDADGAADRDGELMVTPMHLHPSTDETFYRLASEPVVTDGPPAPVDFDRIRAAALQTGAIEILGPPPL